jgi:hypothetical protein
MAAIKPNAIPKPDAVTSQFKATPYDYITIFGH